MMSRLRLPCRTAIFAIATCAAAGLASAPTPVAAEALLLVEVDTGKVLHAERATTPWYPASITKIMTAYVTLRAVKEGRVRLDTLFRISGTAAAAAPTKMGFPPGTTVTVDNALKMLMVKSANDIAVVIAEGVSGSVENFADLMNAHARRLGMTQSHFVNPHGLPAEEQITSARDMAILARTVLREFPEYNHYWSLPGIQMGKRVHRNHNNLMGRYLGTDGMKTGFICASGFNVVATATRNNKRLIAVVLGSPSPAVRAVKAAQLFERGFQVRALSWLTPGLGQVDALQPTNVDPPNLREQMCGKNCRRPAVRGGRKRSARRCACGFSLRRVPVEPARPALADRTDPAGRPDGCACSRIHRSSRQAKRSLGCAGQRQVQGKVKDRKEQEPGYEGDGDGEG